MPGSWSEIENAAIVADYFAMLELELRGVPYNKAQHNLQLRALLNDRTKGSVELKHQNISAILLEQEFPYIDGYKPLANYQEQLRTEVISRLPLALSLKQAAASAVTVEVDDVPFARATSDIFAPIPVRKKRTTAVYERKIRTPVVRTVESYLEQESRNSSLGIAGEMFVLDLEHRRLFEAGRKHLADKIEHVSKTVGDGLGYDIVSFESNGAERLIEVKTTTFGAFTPFFASGREVAVSDEQSERYKLYRLYKFLEQPKVFVLDGSLRQSCALDPVQFRATVR